LEDIKNEIIIENTNDKENNNINNEKDKDKKTEKVNNSKNNVNIINI